MNQKQFLLTLLLAVISAFLGGTVGVWFLMPPSVLVQDETPKVIEAEEFRVVDAVGRERAVLDSIGLSIYAPPNEEPVASYNFMGLSAQSEVGAVKLDYIEGLTIQVNDALLWFDPEFGLRLESGPAVLAINVSDEGEVSLTLSGEPNISLHDKKGNLRAVLGTTQLKHPDTGSTEIRAPSSLVLFDEEGNVVWSAP